MELFAFELQWLWTSSGSIISLLTSLLGFIVFVAFVWKQLKREGVEKLEGDQSLCNSPNCVRCEQSRKSNDIIISTLKERSLRYLAQQHGFSDLDQAMATNYPRILSAIWSLKEKSIILRSVYESSGFEISGPITHHPHIWTVPDLTRAPFWDSQTHSQLQSIALRLSTNSTFDKILKDYKRAKLSTEGWQLNTTPTGQWNVYPLYNQGQKVCENCQNCPKTLEVLESFPSLMNGCIYGNAMFSVLDPGSVIEPHTGPCNFRLRCHVPLIVPSGFKVQVGTEIVEWKVGELLVFDDSFVHRVWHESAAGKHLKPEKDCRVVLIFDIWHPQLTTSEVDLLRICFSKPF